MRKTRSQQLIKLCEEGISEDFAMQLVNLINTTEKDQHALRMSLMVLKKLITKMFSIDIVYDTLEAEAEGREVSARAQAIDGKRL